jgi:hypothetical protein
MRWIRFRGLERVRNEAGLVGRGVYDMESLHWYIWASWTMGETLLWEAELLYMGGVYNWTL